jgi:integrase
MSRSRKGHGSIVKLANGKFLVKIPAGKDAKGSTRYVTKTCNSQSEARKIHSALLAQRESNKLIAGERVTLQKYATDVLMTSSDYTSDRTRDGYFRLLRTHVFPVLGANVLREINSRQIESLLGEIRNKKAAGTVNNVRVALSKVFSEALRHQLVPFNPVALTKKAKRGEFEPTNVCLPWSKEEVAQALSAASGTSMEVPLTLAVALGVRRGELLGLRWQAIDFEYETVSIEETIHRESLIQRDGSTISRVVVGPPKTASSRRINQLSRPVLDLLRRHKLEQEIQKLSAGDKWVETGYVLTNKFGGPLDESKFAHRYRSFLRKHGIRPIRIHDIRHTFATLLIEEDPGQLASVSKALGHSSIAITMDVYASTARVDTKATSRMSEILFPSYGKITPISVIQPSRTKSSAPSNWRAV